MRKAIIKNGIVQNIIEIAPAANWVTPGGCILVSAPDAIGPGDLYDGMKFSKAGPAPEELAAQVKQAKLQAARDRIGKAIKDGKATAIEIDMAVAMGIVEP